MLKFSLLFLSLVLSSSAIILPKYYGGGKPPPAPRTTTVPVPIQKCEDGWHLFDRASGPWCVKVGPVRGDYSKAKAACTALGAVPTGFDNNAEKIWVADEASRQTVLYRITYSAVWVGAEKNLTTGEFQWTDGHSTGPIIWARNQPDNNDSGQGPQNCIQMICLSTEFWENPNNWRENLNGDLDDYWCGYFDNPPQRMYACGKPGRK